LARKPFTFLPPLRSTYLAHLLTQYAFSFLVFLLFPFHVFVVCSRENSPAGAKNMAVVGCCGGCQISEEEKSISTQILLHNYVPLFPGISSAKVYSSLAVHLATRPPPLDVCTLDICLWSFFMIREDIWAAAAAGVYSRASLRQQLFRKIAFFARQFIQTRQTSFSSFFFQIVRGS
jgi:hypothetical protein